MNLDGMKFYGEGYIPVPKEVKDALTKCEFVKDKYGNYAIKVTKPSGAYAFLAVSEAEAAKMEVGKIYNINNLKYYEFETDAAHSHDGQEHTCVRYTCA